jgi:hypothetical protein
VDVTKITAIVTLLIGLSIASERFVEIIKGFVPGLNEPRSDPRLEGRRRGWLQALAVLAGIATAFAARPVIPTEIYDATTTSGLLALGLLASGGSGLWNSILGIASGAKELKKVQVELRREGAAIDAGAHRDLDLGTERVTSNECYDVKGA